MCFRSGPSLRKYCAWVPINSCTALSIMSPVVRESFSISICASRYPPVCLFTIGDCPFSLRCNGPRLEPSLDVRNADAPFWSAHSDFQKPGINCRQNHPLIIHAKRPCSRGRGQCKNYLRRRACARHGGLFVWIGINFAGAEPCRQRPPCGATANDHSVPPAYLPGN